MFMMIVIGGRMRLGRAGALGGTVGRLELLRGDDVARGISSVAALRVVGGPVVRDGWCYRRVGLGLAPELRKDAA